MRYLERFSINIYKIAFSRPLEKFRSGSIESVLRRAMSLIDEETKRDIKEFIRDHQSGTGAFVDKAGMSDLYYTLFGYLTASALDMKEIMPVLKSYIENEIQNNKLSGVNLYCAAVICPGLCDNQKYIDFLRDSVRNNLEEYLQNKGGYGAFLSLLGCYYLNDYKSLYTINRQLKLMVSTGNLPSPVNAAMLVLREALGKNNGELKKVLFSFYDKKGGFRATLNTPLPDLLSTAVALYALRFSGADLRSVRADCLAYTDSLYNGGGFGANVIDTDPDIEYTFYGLLSLGSLA